jgi:hypothetical protein
MLLLAVMKIILLSRRNSTMNMMIAVSITDVHER